jgi:hypothetical protein
MERAFEINGLAGTARNQFVVNISEIVDIKGSCPVQANDKPGCHSSDRKF